MLILVVYYLICIEGTCVDIFFDLKNNKYITPHTKVSFKSLPSHEKLISVDLVLVFGFKIYEISR